MLKNNTRFLIGILIMLDVLIIVGLGVSIAQIITQWVNIGGIIVYINMWTATFTVSNSIVIFIVSLCLGGFAVGLFIGDFTHNILLVKNQNF